MWLKICGMTSADAVAAALQARVDAIGFVFSPSVRRLQPDEAAQLAAPARGRVSLVAVTVQPQQHLIDDILRVFQPDVLQTDLRDFDVLTLPDTLERLPVLRAGIGSGAALPRRLLFEGARSGSGEAADWNTASRLARMSELILAGGLNAHNVGAAIHAVRPHGVDVSSGVESAPGRKSAQMIVEFVDAARAAFQEMAHDER